MIPLHDSNIHLFNYFTYTTFYTQQLLGNNNRINNNNNDTATVNTTILYSNNNDIGTDIVYDNSNRHRHTLRHRIVMWSLRRVGSIAQFIVEYKIHQASGSMGLLSSLIKHITSKHNRKHNDSKLDNNTQQIDSHNK